MWVSELGLPFPAGHLRRSEPTTHASMFCVAAFRFLDPALPPQRIHNEMRKSVTAMNNRRRKVAGIRLTLHYFSHKLSRVVGSLRS